MDDDEEVKKQLFQAIVESFNKIGMMAMNQLANGNDGFTLTNGPWTVTLDLGGFLDGINGGETESKKVSTPDRMRGIIEGLVKPWHENLNRKREKK